MSDWEGKTLTLPAGHYTIEELAQELDKYVKAEFGKSAAVAWDGNHFCFTPPSLDLLWASGGES